MGNEKYFDENVVLYDKYRPTYCDEVYNAIISYANIGTNSKIIEIGCGTGNATRPFLDTGAQVTAVELGEQLSEFTKNKFKIYNNFNVINMKFEDYNCEEKVDLIFSATAFHWIPSEISYPKCRKMLKSNGVLAVFWNKPENSEKNPELKKSIQELYDSYLHYDKNEPYEKRCERLQWFIKMNGYEDIFFKIYKNYRTFNADEYIGLLHTYSDHMALQEDIRNEFFGKIHAEIEKYSTIEIEDTIDLHMGRNIL